MTGHAGRWISPDAHGPSGLSTPSPRRTIVPPPRTADARRLRVVRGLAVQHPGQPDRLAREVDAGQVRSARGGVALVEEQVQDLAHRAKTRGRVGGGAEAAAPPRGFRPGGARRPRPLAGGGPGGGVPGGVSAGSGPGRAGGPVPVCGRRRSAIRRVRASAKRGSETIFRAEPKTTLSANTAH